MIEYVNLILDDEVVKVVVFVDNNKVVIFECVGVSCLLNDYILCVLVKVKIVVIGVYIVLLNVNFVYVIVKELDFIFFYYY